MLVSAVLSGAVVAGIGLDALRKAHFTGPCEMPSFQEEISLTRRYARLACGRFLLERGGPMVVQIANLTRLWDF
jgi:hypothetical protein